MISEFHELVRQRMRRLRKKVGRTGEENRGDLAGSPAHRKNCTGQNTGYGARQDDFADGLPLCRSKSQARFPQFAGNGTDSFFHRDNDHRQRQKCHGETCPENARLSPQERSRGQEGAIEAVADELNEEPKSEKPEHDGRDAGKRIDRKPDEPAEERALLHVFRKIDCGDDPHRHANNRHDDHEEEGTDDSRENSARGHALFGRGSEKLPGDMRQAPDDNIEHEVEYYPDYCGCAQAGKPFEEKTGNGFPGKKGPLHFELPLNRFIR